MSEHAWGWPSVVKLSVAVAVIVLVAGCAGDKPPPSSGGQGSQGAGTSTLPASQTEVWRPRVPSVPLTDPLELDQGRLLLPTPEGWTLRRARGYELFCYRGNYPRLLLQVEEDPEFHTLTQENLAQFLTALRVQLGQRAWVEPVRGVQVGRFLGASYAWEAQARGSRLVRFFLITVHEGRRYILELRALEATYRSYRPVALAVAAQAKFVPKGEVPEGESN